LRRACIFRLTWDRSCTILTLAVNTHQQRLRARVRKSLANFDPPMTLAALAKELGISRSYLSMLLNGDRRMSLEMAVRLERLTGVDLREFAKVVA
jgi:plasmid maintenance system antidote protein VapI